MKKEMIFSDVFYAHALTYDSNKDNWNCKMVIYYKEDRNSAESESLLLTIDFSKKGEIEYEKNDEKECLTDILNEIRCLDPFRTYFKECKEVILDIRDIRLFTPNEIGEFHYDYNQKIGWFRFEDSLVQYKFSFVPNKGIEKVLIIHGEHNLDSAQVKVVEKATKLFGEKQTNIINDMIKKEIKLRYFF